MWSTTGSVPKHGEVHINHFVPLLPKCVPAVDSSAINLTESPDKEHDAEKGDYDIVNDVFFLMQYSAGEQCGCKHCG